MRLPSDAVAFGSDELSDRQPDAAGSFPRVDPPQQASRRLACGSLHTSVRVRGGALVLGRGARRRPPCRPARGRLPGLRTSPASQGFLVKLKTGCAEAGEVGVSPRPPAPHPSFPRPPRGDCGGPGVQMPPPQGPPQCPHCLCPLSTVASGTYTPSRGMGPRRPPPPLRSAPSSTLCSRRPSRDEPTQTSGSAQTPPAFPGLGGQAADPRCPHPSRQPGRQTLPAVPASAPGGTVICLAAAQAGVGPSPGSLSWGFGHGRGLLND